MNADFCWSRSRRRARRASTRTTSIWCRPRPCQVAAALTPPQNSKLVLSPGRSEQPFGAGSVAHADETVISVRGRSDASTSAKLADTFRPIRRAGYPPTSKCTSLPNSTKGYEASAPTRTSTSATREGPLCRIVTTRSYVESPWH